MFASKIKSWDSSVRASSQLAGEYIKSESLNISFKNWSTGREDCPLCVSEEKSLSFLEKVKTPTKTKKRCKKTGHYILVFVILVKI